MLHSPDVEMICNASHGDPFAVLGPHAVVRRQANALDAQSDNTAWHGKPHSIVVNLPPLATVWFEWTA